MAKRMAKAKQTGDADLTLGELSDLDELREQGNIEAMRICQEIAMANGREDWEEYSTLTTPEMPLDVKDKIGKMMGASIGIGSIFEDDAYKMTMMRFEQLKISSDPVMRVLAEDMGKSVVNKFVTRVKKQMTRPIKMPTKSSTIKTGKKKRKCGKWDDTEMKIQRLKKYRKDWQASHSGKIPPWTVACSAVGIDPKTARTHAKDLREHWEDKDY